MQIDILTLFPDVVAALNTYGVIGRAIERGTVGLGVVDIRDYAQNKHRKVDDAPFGGGAGMLMQCEPIEGAIASVRTEKSHVVYLSPQGKVLTQQRSIELAEMPHLVLLCGHYEGIDERVVETLIDEEISIGDYVLTGGELPAMVLTDAVCRHIEETVGSPESVETDSLSDGLLKYPQYTRPRVWNGLEVPEVLLSGNHAWIEAWRHEASWEATKRKRPDLYQKKADALKDENKSDIIPF